MRIEAYERQPTWRLAMKLVATMYRLTHTFPQEEKSGLAVAIRRTITAVPAKLADAHGQHDPDQAIKAFDTTTALLRELQTNLQIAWQLRILSKWKLNRLRTRCQRLCNLIERCIETCEQVQLAQKTKKRRQAALPTKRIAA